MRDRKRRRSARVLIAGLGLGAVGTVDELVAEVGRALERRIVRLPLPDRAPVGLSGLWLTVGSGSGDAVEVVLYRESGEAFGRLQDVAHELGHIILRSAAERGDRFAGRVVEASDSEGPVSDEVRKYLLGNSIEPDQIRSARREGTFGAEEEIMAEVIGSQLAARCQADPVPELSRLFGWSP